MYTHDTLTDDQWKIEEISNPIKGIIVMQFTGLLDRNGVEIYEGDILGHTTAGKKKVVSDVIKWSSEPEPQEDGEFGWYATYLGYSLSEEWNKKEIIGNIYENPELLK